MKHFLKKFFFLKIYFSPLKNPKLKWYFGEIQHGVPYFLPRKIVKTKANWIFKSVKYFYIQFLELGWKTKWGDDDFRFEWNPMISIVIFNKQLCIWMVSPTDDEYSYWETWLAYYYLTNRKAKTMDRFYELLPKYSNKYTRYTKDEEIKGDYYPSLLKKKYKKLYEQWIL